MRVVLFRDPLLAVLADGVVNAIPPTWPPMFDRAAAFWFMLFSPALVMLGQITRRAAVRRDGPVIRTTGLHLLGLGVVGVAVMPVSGFWILIALAPLLLRTAARVEASADSLESAKPAL